jgi:carbonic anhydrase/acetyltransferase-like protein (isoleucine patch superfamily)
MGAILLNAVVVGSGSVIAGGAVLPEGMQVPPRSLVMGVPARVVRPVDDVLTERIKRTWRSYVKLAEEHRRGGFEALPH